MKLILLSVCLLLVRPVTAAETPNFVVIMADDCTFRDLEIHGGQAKTPNLVKLEAEGMKFERCFQSSPTCSPTRHNLLTGLYPVKSGAWPNHTKAYDHVKSIAHYLQEAGYRTHLSGKRHILPESVFPFEYSGKNNPDMKAVRKLFGESARSKKPFFLFAASNEPHSPHDKGDASIYPPDKIKLTPIQADTPRTRQALSNYFAEITFFDSQVGRILSALEEAGLKENTMVIVLSEQGYDLPYAKWTCYDAGLGSACVVRWPGKIKPGSVSKAMVEYVDIVPTVLDAAGRKQPGVLDGESFLSVLAGGKDTHKTHAFGQQTSKGIIAGPEHYGIRTVRNERYRYIRNLTPEVKFQNYTTKGPVFASWVEAGRNGDVNAEKLAREFQQRPAEELYDCENDPWNRNNLIADKSLQPVVTELKEKLAGWMKSQGDEGQATEEKAFTRMPGKARKKGAAE